MSLPYKVASLLFCFNERDETLLLERAQEPNRGCWSPCGGKLKIDIGESPYVCACREAREEIGVELSPFPICIWPASSASTAMKARRTG